MVNDDDDDEDDPKTVLLDEGADDTDGYDASSSALGKALGPRWNPQKLEDEANKNTNTLLQGIDGQRKAVGVMSKMLAALP